MFKKLRLLTSLWFGITAYSYAHGVDCELFLNMSSVQNQVREFRSKRVQADLSALRIPLAWDSYKIIGSLGHGSVNAILVEKNGSLFVAKTNINSKRSQIGARFFWRDVIMTEYLQAIGQPVAEVHKVHVGRENGEISILKKYFEGLSGMELSEFSELYGVETHLIYEQGTALAARLRTIVNNGEGRLPSFKTWYSANMKLLEGKYPDLWSKVINEPRYGWDEATQGAKPSPHLDFLEGVTDIFAQNNMIYDFTGLAWIVIDP